ncbi:ribulokinase [Mucilaginibacter ginkgonis]|uniref:Ribulokinase n=1 Tax=Mucilaginibacter ginkgonis TaxID=2682091 RepID=A0A6I4HVG3_9SPHI|nr:ribulokinase [Mucilaginibacter ginkgonis]QQL50386.1 ribulokinase [Mucilaginibacter ginkgonis]
MEQYVIGVDYGTDSVRTVIINAEDGSEMASSVFNYPRWQKGLYCDARASQFRQHPLDYIEGLETTIINCVKQAGPNVAAKIKAISIDATGSTPVAVDISGTPLALLPGFEENPDAMFILWKDHAAVEEAAKINGHAKDYDADYLKYIGGIYSSEWFWAKLMHVMNNDEAVADKLYTWLEHTDWMPFLLTGGTNANDIKRNRCAAGHKGLWAEEFDGLPPKEFFMSLDPKLDKVYATFAKDTYTADKAAGTISTEWADKLGLPTDVLIGIGAIDAHMGAVGGEIEPYYLSKVMGTSTCDMLVIPVDEIKAEPVAGICGQVNGSIIPGMIGLEAGQSAFGDVYAWFKNLISWPIDQLLPRTKLISAELASQLRDELEGKILNELSATAAQLPLADDDELAIEWLNGRRTPDANPLVKGAVTGLDLGTDAPRMFRALAEATCFGAKSIVDRFIAEGVPVKGIIGIGGVAKKSPYIMQMMADVLGMSIKVHRYEHTCALGAAMFASVVAGIFPNVEGARQAMGGGFDKIYQPNDEVKDHYLSRYAKYKRLGDFIEGA